MVDDSNFPSESVEAHGRFVGFSESVGHIMTFQILTNKTKKIICQSSLRFAIKPSTHNYWLDYLSLTDIFQVPNPGNPVIYEQPNPNSKNGEDFLRFSDQEFAFVHFPRGTKITKFIDKKPVTGNVLQYNEDAVTYFIMFPGGKTEKSFHGEVRELYNPIIERRDPSVINEEINVLELKILLF